MIIECESPPRARVVLLGASNLRRGLPSLLQTSWRRLGCPLEVLIANGHGRSYGLTSRIPGRKLPGIVPCQLWNDLEALPTLPTFALLTDVGNDLLYGVSPTQLIDWIAACLERLASHGAKVVVTQLPIGAISGLGEARYRIFRKLFSPSCRYPLATIIERAQTTNDNLISLARQQGCNVVEPQQHWYGFDAIHVRRWYFPTAWRAFTEPWTNVAMRTEDALFPVKNRLALHFAAPYERWLWGVHRVQDQPCLNLTNGSTIALY